MKSFDCRTCDTRSDTVIRVENVIWVPFQSTFFRCRFYSKFLAKFLDDVFRGNFQRPFLGAVFRGHFQGPFLGAVFRSGLKVPFLRDVFRTRLRRRFQTPFLSAVRFKVIFLRDFFQATFLDAVQAHFELILKCFFNSNYYNVELQAKLRQLSLKKTRSEIRRQCL